MDKAGSLEADDGDVSLVVQVVSKTETKVFKYGRSLRLGRFMVEDASGKIEFTLWEDMIDLVKEGDYLVIKRGFVREYRGMKNVTLGKDGELINLSGE